MSLSPFDIAKNINAQTGILPLEEVSGSDYMLNAIYSNTKDTVFAANEANKFGYHLPKDATYRFYYHLLPKNPRRYGKWHKRPVVDDDIKLIKQVYGYNTERALEVLPMLQSNLPALREYAFKGGFGR